MPGAGVWTGEKDLQVPPKENLEEIEKAIRRGAIRAWTTKQLPGLNHLFQACKTGAVAEYAEIEETIAPAALKVIGDWVVGRSSFVSCQLSVFKLSLSLHFQRGIGSAGRFVEVDGDGGSSFS